MSSNLAVDPGASAFDHSHYSSSLPPPIVDFTDIPLCFAPPYMVPICSKSADTLPCMDHPDLPAGLRLPRKSKSSRSSKSDHDVRLYPVSRPYISAESEEKRSKSPRPFDQRVSNTQTFVIHRAVEPVESVFNGREQALKPIPPPQPHKNAVSRRRFLLLSRKSKPAPIKIVPDDASDRQQQAQRQVMTRRDSRLTPNKSGSSSPTKPSITTPALSPRDGTSAKSLTPPSTPGFVRRLLERIETAPRPRTPSPTFSFEDTPKPVEVDLDETHDLALFAAATAGLSPEQPFAPEQMRQYFPLSRSRPEYTRSKSYTSHVSRPLEADEELSLASLSHGSLSNPVADPYYDCGYCNPSEHSRSRPCLPRMSSENGPHDIYRLSQSSPLSGWNTPMGREINARRETGPKRLSASRSFDGRRVDHVVQNMPPMPISSRPIHPPLPTPLLQTSSHPQIQAQLSMKSFPPNPHITAPIMSPISPADTAVRWLDDNVSALSVDTLTYRHNPRISAISTLSGISTIDGGVSPLEPEDDCELPNYQSSQEEMARMHQLENVKRAQELQMRWMLSRRN